MKASVAVAESDIPEENQKLPDVRFEAYVIEDRRILDGDDDFIRFDKGIAEDERSLDNLDHRRAARGIEEGQLQGGWTFQNATVVRQKIKRTIERELGNQDLMSKEDASKVGVNLQKVCVVQCVRHHKYNA